jgi:oligoribonuclease NrnB/cAMP/cGMP phosphodiesterase (DHH superfamily)
MPTVISHNDADGIISVAALFMKYPEKKFSVYFATPSNLKLVLCKAIAKSFFGDELFVFDLTANKETVKLASFFNCTWIDHHIWDDFVIEPNIKVVNNVTYASAARLCADYFGLNGMIFGLADEIDKNNATSEEAVYLRDLIDGIRFFDKKYDIKLKSIASKLAKGFENIKSEENDAIVERYRKWVKEIEADVEKRINVIEKNGIKVVFLTTNKNIPTRVVVKRVKELGIEADIVAVFYYYVKKSKIFTKIEFRSNEYDVFELARRFGGGGHKNASGATAEGMIKIDDLLSWL